MKNKNGDYKVKKKKLSKVQILLIISAVLFVGFITFASIPAVSVALGGCFGFFFFVMIFATIIVFIKEPRINTINENNTIEKNESRIVEKNETVKVCKYCGADNKPTEVKCSNCGANLKSK